MKKLLKPLAIAMLAGTTLTGCIGQFALTDKVYEWNKSQGNRWVAEGLFLVMNIIPVYGAAVFIDAIALNSIEFWTRTNPLTGKRAVVTNTPETMTTPDGSTVTMTYKPDGAIDVDYRTLAGQKGAFTLVKTDDHVTMLSTDGTVLASADSNGQLSL